MYKALIGRDDEALKGAIMDLTVVLVCLEIGTTESRELFEDRIGQVFSDLRPSSAFDVDFRSFFGMLCPDCI